MVRDSVFPVVMLALDAELRRRVRPPYPIIEHTFYPGLMAPRPRRATRRIDPIIHITGDPAEIRTAALKVWQAWQAHVAAGHADDGRFEPLRKIFAQNDEDLLRATAAIKWQEARRDKVSSCGTFAERCPRRCLT